MYAYNDSKSRVPQPLNMYVHKAHKLHAKRALINLTEFVNQECNTSSFMYVQLTRYYSGKVIHTGNTTLKINAFLSTLHFHVCSKKQLIS